MPSFLQTTADQFPAFTLLFLMFVAWSFVIELLVRTIGLMTRKRSASTRCFVLQAGFLALAIAPVCYLCLPGVGLLNSASNIQSVVAAEEVRRAPGDIATSTSPEGATRDVAAAQSVAPKPTTATDPHGKADLFSRIDLGLVNFVSLLAWIWVAVAAWQLVRLLFAQYSAGNCRSQQQYRSVGRLANDRRPDCETLTHQSGRRSAPYRRQG